MNFRTIIAASAAMLLSSTAFAQNTWVEIDDEIVVPGWNLTVGDAEDYDVYDGAGNQVGEIGEILGTAGATPNAATVEFADDGFFDDDPTRVVELSMLELRDDRMVMSGTQEAARELPVYAN